MQNVKKLRKRLYLLTFLFVASLGLILTVMPSAQALSGNDFHAGRIIDDAVFFDGNAMSTQEIQDFLNAKVPTCDTNGSQQSSHWNDSAKRNYTRAEWGNLNGYAPPYTCLRNYSENTPTKNADSYCTNTYNGGVKSAAQIINDVARACNVSQKTLIVLLQKEQSLVTDDWPWSIQYRSATGYGCPDTAACDSEYYGYFNQLYNAARQFQRYVKQSQMFNYRSGQTSYIQYNPSSGCGGSNVYIENPATAALYNYTPYQPNTSALVNLYDSGDGCSAYGNRNFWRMFNDWFGTTTGPPYGWSIESFTYSGGDNYIAIGQTETVTLRAKNIGRTPWYNHGNNPVRLGTWQPADRSSSLSTGWPSGNRAANLTESVVPVGSIGTFTFQITPNRQGTFVEPLNLVAENSQWASWPGFSPTINVTSAYNWQVESIQYGAGTGLLEPGTSQLITLRARNTGSATWSKSGPNPVRLGTWQPDRSSAVANNWLSSTRVADMNETSVAPGQIAGFQFNVRVPSSGQYYERLNLVSENQTWLNDTGATLYLEGGTYKWQPVWVSPSTGTYSINRSTNFTLTVRTRNTGTAVWRKSSGYPIRIGTSSPLNRGSGLEYSTWLSSTRPTGLLEDIVAPGQEGTFSFMARTPDTPGLRSEHFNLVAEGVIWFTDPNFSINVNVL